MDKGTHNQKYKGNITNLIYEVAAEFPDNAAFLYPDQLSFHELTKEIDCLVQGFREIGIQKGHKVLFLVKPGKQMFILVLSIIRIGAIPILIDSGMGPKAMMSACSKLHIDVFIGNPKAHLLRIVYPSAFKNIHHFITTGISLFRYAETINKIKSTEIKRTIAAEIKPKDDIAIFFTSGSTGPAKAVLYSNEMLHAQIEILHSKFNYRPDEIDCCTFPLIGLLVMCLGLSVVIADMDMTKPASLKPKRVFNNILDHKCTHLFCSPMVLRKLAEYGIKENIKLPSLKKVMTAGAIIPPELLIKFDKLLDNDAKIHTPYGATEALPITDICHRELLDLYADAKVFKEGVCIGYPMSEIELKIIKIEDHEINKINKIEELIIGEVGEIIVKGNNVSQKYLGIKNHHYSKIWDDKHHLFWHRMGDLGRLDNKGRIWFYGRKSQRVKTKNGTLFTIPVEALFNTHPAVYRSALIGINNNHINEPIICIQLKKRKAQSKKMILQELLQIAINQDIDIKTFKFYKEFPMDPRHNAKIYREKLTQWAKK